MWLKQKAAYFVINNKRIFRLKYNPEFKKAKAATSSLKNPSLKPPNPRPSTKPTSPPLPSPPSPTHLAFVNAKALTDLIKMYQSDEHKFGNKLYNIFKAKLKIFKNLCQKAGISDA